MNDEIIASIYEGLSGATDELDVQVELDGNRALITVVSPMFSGMSRVAKQQAVYACIRPSAINELMHA